jgi:hypothetical protein
MASKDEYVSGMSSLARPVCAFISLLHWLKVFRSYLETFLLLAYAVMPWQQDQRIPYSELASLVLSIRLVVLWTSLRRQKKLYLNSNNRVGLRFLLFRRPLVSFFKVMILTKRQIHLPGSKLVPSVRAAMGTPNLVPLSRFPLVRPETTKMKCGQSASVRNTRCRAVPESSMSSISSPLRPKQNPTMNQVPISAIWRLRVGRLAWRHSASRIRSN